jgi:Tol biopolymer transport system component
MNGERDRGRFGARWVVQFACLALLVACSGSTGSNGAGGASPTTASGSSAAAAPLIGQIAFVEDPTSDRKHGQIYLERADGGNVRQLVHSTANDLHPVLSRDGKRILFTREVESKPDRIYEVNVDGSGLRAIASSNCPDICSDAVEGAAWSPDGRTIAFTRAIFHGHSADPNNVEVWLMNADGKGAHRLTHGSIKDTSGKASEWDGSASWSPDGRRLVFTHSVFGDTMNQLQLLSVKVDGTDIQPLTPNDVNAGDAVWSPDGALIAFQSPPDEEGVVKNLYTVRSDGKGMTALTFSADGADSNHPSWSPDGKQIVFSHIPPGAVGADLYVMNRDGSNVRPIATTPLNEDLPSWSK